MSNSLRQAVNQRLYFANLHLGWLQEQLQRQEIAKTVVEQALGESILHHLIQSYRCYLQELAAAYQLKGVAPVNAVELGRLLEVEQKEGAECEELLVLEQEDSWLSRLQTAYAQLGNSQNLSAAVTNTGQDTILLHQIDREVFSSADLASATESLQELIARQRKHSEEW